MVLTAERTLWLGVVGASALVGAAYGGLIESVIAPTALPGPPPTAAFVVVGLLLLGSVGSSYLDHRAWAAVGREAGLSRGDAERFDAPPPDDVDGPLLGGVVDGRPVRAWTYTTGGGQNTSATRYTVVSAALRDPVEWHATFGFGAAEEMPDDADVDATETTTVDGVGVRGDVDEAVAGEVLTARATDAVAAVEGEVSVGDPTENLVDDMLDELDDEDGMAATLTGGVLNVATGGGADPGPSRTAQHSARGRVTDAETLETRIEAVVAVADGVERASAATD